MVDVLSNRTEYQITGLETGTEYVVSVFVLYITGTRLESENMTVQTSKSKDDNGLYRTLSCRKCTCI